MKTRDWIIVIGLTILILAIFKKPITVAAAKLTRGYRNRNPGNIEKTPSLWKGEVKGTDTRFKTFQSMAWGYRAIFVTLNSYFKKGFNTIEKIISRYAPSSENYTDAYIRTVATRTGIDPGRQLSFTDTGDLTKIVAAISFVENGIEPDPAQINEGLNLFKKG